MNIIGKPRRRVDGRAKVTGQTRFADDLTLPRMLWCRLLRSHLPHARVDGVDTAAAAAARGVKLVLTGADFPIPYGILPVSQDEHALAQERVRFVGDPVAAVIATSEEAAQTPGTALHAADHHLRRPRRPGHPGAAAAHLRRGRQPAQARGLRVR